MNRYTMEKELEDGGRMTTLSECLNLANKEGYTENFSVKNHLLFSPTGERFYQPEDTHVVNYYRFEGSSNPDDMAILYVIRTTDGKMGTLVDAYGPYANAAINEFILRVHDIHKREAQ